MTLAEAINVALRLNRSVKSAYLSRVVEKFDLRVAQDKFNPNVDLSAGPYYADFSTRTAASPQKFESNNTGLDANLAVTKMIETGGRFAFSWNRSDLWTRTNLTQTNRSDTNTWTVNFTQPLLKGGGIDVNTASVTLAELSEQSNLLSLKDSISSTVRATISAFRSYAQTTRQLEITKSSLQRAKDLLEMNKFFISVGRMAANELIQTESDVANQEFSYETALNGLDSARLNLLKILNMDKATMIVPKEEGEPIAVHPNFDVCLKTAFENRSDYLNANMGMDRSKISLTLARNNMLWDLNFVGSYAIIDANQRLSSNSDNQNWRVGLNLAIPLYGDLTREQGLIGAQINLEKTKLSLDEITENITIEVQDAIREVETKLKQVGMAKRARELSEKKLEVEEEKLKVGRTTNFQMVTFQNDLVTAQNAELDASIAFRNALTSLDQILGTTLNTWKIDYNKEYDKWPGK
jgi:outer membrane protein